MRTQQSLLVSKKHALATEGSDFSGLLSYSLYSVRFYVVQIINFWVSKTPNGFIHPLLDRSFLSRIARD